MVCAPIPAPTENHKPLRPALPTLDTLISDAERCNGSYLRSAHPVHGFRFQSRGDVLAFGAALAEALPGVDMRDCATFYVRADGVVVLVSEAYVREAP